MKYFTFLLSDKMERKKIIKNILDLGAITGVVMKYDYRLEGNIKHIFKTGDSKIVEMKLIDENRVFLSKNDGIFEIWNLKTFDLEATVNTNLRTRATQMVIIGNKIVVGSEKLVIWDLETYGYSIIDSRRIADLFELPNNRIIFTTEDSIDAKIYNLNNNQLETTIEGERIKHTLVVDEIILISFIKSQQHSLKLFNQCGDLLSTLDNFFNIDDIRVSLVPLPGKKVMAISYKGLIKLISYKDGKLKALHEFEVDANVEEAKMLSDKWVSLYADGAINVFNIDTQRRVFPQKNAIVVDMLPNDKIIVGFEGLKIYESENKGRFFDSDEDSLIEHMIILKEGVLVADYHNMYLYE